jgi:hypothetical protein
VLFQIGCKVWFSSSEWGKAMGLHQLGTKQSKTSRGEILWRALAVIELILFKSLIRAIDFVSFVKLKKE